MIRPFSERVDAHRIGPFLFPAFSLGDGSLPGR